MAFYMFTPKLCYLSEILIEQNILYYLITLPSMINYPVFKLVPSSFFSLNNCASIAKRIGHLLIQSTNNV